LKLKLVLVLVILLPGVFGSTDLIGRIGNRAVVLDWKFGDGVAVEVEENPQLMFYAAAAMRTEEAKWAFVDVEEIEMVIVQPPAVKRWVTTPARIAQFEKDLVKAVKLAQQPNAELKVGDHCRWCAAKPICPQMTGAVDRALKTQSKRSTCRRWAPTWPTLICWKIGSKTCVRWRTKSWTAVHQCLGINWWPSVAHVNG
jgi:hypothetical protein